MLVTYNWLMDYVDLDIDPHELADKLTMLGLEVEEVHDRYEYLDNVIVGRVAEVQNHPRSEKLKVCQVETGQSTYQVVCGAPNVAKGMLSALALAGTVLPGGDVVQEVELRGVRSSANLCSEAELVVGPDASGVITFPENLNPGTKLRDVLKLTDWIFEIDITPNRPDCLCVLGVAREIAGMLGLPLKYPEIKIEEAPERAEDLTSIQILDPERCPRYVGRVINGVKIGPSPFWMVERLAGVGLRSINNIVDITNFVLMETGQPLHAFDLDRLDERRIVVKTAEEGDRFTTLDGEERIMGPEMLMICDGKKPVGLAGVMGGLNSEIIATTSDVLLESAYFNPVSIRRTSKTLDLSTDASFRFERGIDPQGCDYAASRAAALMAELAEGRVAAGVIDENPRPYKKLYIPFSPSRCNSFLGTKVEPQQMLDTLGSIGLAASGTGDNIKIEAPSFRVDLTREVDLYEEVARLVGYDEIPVTLPSHRGETEQPDPSRRLRAEIGEILEGLGLSEAISYSFISNDFCDKLDLPENDNHRKCVRILNPLSEEQMLLRTTLVPGLLDVLSRNQSFQVMDLGMFEIGKLFYAVDGQELPEEKWAVGGLMAGARADQSWNNKAGLVDFYDLKGVVEELLENVNVTAPVFIPEGMPVYYDQAVAAQVSVEGRILGNLGRITTQVANAFDLKDVPYIFELDLDSISAAQAGVRTFSPLPRFPAISRDLALVLDRKAEAGKILDFIKGLEEEFLSEVSLFDAYEGRQLKKNFKSLAFRFLYRSPERTLTDEEVNAVHQRVVDKIMANFAVEIRT
ncbi:MAG: phenylalanine--tRNA ligase subunit beta [Deltaproteobacteria bacterium]|nr:phenylalanine--tRNA ligase subunit beta [Deltaproteobacteria bacterium]MBW2322235.1 phenylalanine--tRNA ligase subunit beta [Deltaproteobacteria bacterium]